MELSEVMRTTGAVRSFDGRAVGDEVLYRVLDDARFAPSGGNLQGWHVTVVRDRALRRRLAELSAAVWRRYIAESSTGKRAYSVIERVGPEVGDAAEARTDLPEHPMLATIDDVPVVLVVTVDLSVLAVMDRDLDRWSVVGGASIYPFVHNVLLAARNQGLGSVLTTFLAAAEAEAGPLLDLPEGHAIVAMIGLGYPAHQPTKLRRRAVGEFTTTDRVTGPPWRPM